MRAALFQESHYKKILALSTSPYLTPGATEPLSAALTGAVVADLRVGRTLVPAALQWKAADVVGQAEDASGSYTNPTFSWALQKNHTAK